MLLYQINTTPPQKNLPFPFITLYVWSPSHPVSKFPLPFSHLVSPENLRETFSFETNFLKNSATMLRITDSHNEVTCCQVINSFNSCKTRSSHYCLFIIALAWKKGLITTWRTDPSAGDPLSPPFLWVDDETTEYSAHSIPHVSHSVLQGQ